MLTERLEARTRFIPQSEQPPWEEAELAEQPEPNPQPPPPDPQCSAARTVIFVRGLLVVGDIATDGFEQPVDVAGRVEGSQSPATSSRWGPR